MIDLNKVGYAISVCRREKGFTQDELASRLGITPQAISKWERGVSLPETDMLPDISKMLNISIDDLLMGNIPMNAAIKDTEAQGDIAENDIVKIEIENPVNVMEFLLPDEILIEISFSLCTDYGTFPNELLSELVNLRLNLVREHGILMPTVRVRDNVSLGDGDYKIYFRKKCFGSGHIYKDMLFTISEDTSLNGITDVDCQGLRMVWMTEAERNNAGNLPYFNGVKLVITHLSHLILKNIDMIVTRQMVKIIVENLSLKHHVLVSEVVPARISYSRLRDILIGILKEKKPINDMVTILETADRLIDDNVTEDEMIIRISKIL